LLNEPTLFRPREQALDRASPVAAAFEWSALDGAAQIRGGDFAERPFTVQRCDTAKPETRCTDRGGRAKPSCSVGTLALDSKQKPLNGIRDGNLTLLNCSRLAGCRRPLPGFYFKITALLASNNDLTRAITSLVRS
jgi:hypothetical protein